MKWPQDATETDQLRFFSARGKGTMEPESVVVLSAG